jgi:dinuclear metal center YbgI/SA1388 family protein
MITNRQALAAMDEIAPFALAEPWDNVGLLLGSPDTEVNKILVALDATSSVIDEAKELGAGLIITHHPIIYHDLKAIAGDSIPWRAIAAGLSVISAHSNLDIAPGGVNDALADRLSLRDIRPLNAAGIGRIGVLTKSMAASVFAAYVRERLGAPTVRYHDSGKPLRVVALCSGSGADYFGDAVIAGADVYVTGEMKHHIWLEAAHLAISAIEAGHFHTENVVIPTLAAALRERLSGVEVLEAVHSSQFIDNM